MTRMKLDAEVVRVSSYPWVAAKPLGPRPGLSRSRLHVGPSQATGTRYDCPLGGNR